MTNAELEQLFSAYVPHTVHAAIRRVQAKHGGTKREAADRLLAVKVQNRNQHGLIRKDSHKGKRMMGIMESEAA